MPPSAAPAAASRPVFPLALVGGTSWVSTLDYYRLINEAVNRRLGGVESARLILHSLNFAEVKRNTDRGDWDATLALVAAACAHMRQGGAQGIVLCANTMHVIAERVEQAVGLPVIHIAEATAQAIAARGLARVALLGTRSTMEMPFFKDRLHAHGIETIVPEPEERDFIHESIFAELGRGVVLPQTRSAYQGIVAGLAARGAGGVVLGCTEIPLVLGPDDVEIPAFDTTRIHAEAAVRFYLSGQAPSADPAGRLPP